MKHFISYSSNLYACLLLIGIVSKWYVFIYIGLGLYLIETGYKLLHRQDYKAELKVTAVLWTICLLSAAAIIIWGDKL